MPIKTKVDHIIVGQGLGGSCLAIQLLNRGKKILVFDEPGKNRASAIAAGLFNPITGKRMSKSWKAKEIFSYLFQFYKNAEELLDQIFFHPQPIYRPFVSVEEQNEWMALSEDEAVKDFIEKIFVRSAFNQASDPFGGILIAHSGYLDVNSFLKAVRGLLMNDKSFDESHFDFDNLIIDSDKIKYSNSRIGIIEASSIIFCDGIGANKNPLLHWLPIRPLKGETLSVSLIEKPEVIFNRGVYLVPTQKNNSFTVGATYQPSDSSEDITLEAKMELEEKLKALIKIPFQIDHQNWGIRPTTPDRRPVMGAHPVFKNVIIFNGLGTKGVSLAPYFSSVLAGWMDGNSEIPREVNMDRFKALYSSLSLF